MRTSGPLSSFETAKPRTLTSGLDSSPNCTRTVTPLPTKPSLATGDEIEDAEEDGPVIVLGTDEPDIRSTHRKLRMRCLSRPKTRIPACIRLPNIVDYDPGFVPPWESGSEEQQERDEQNARRLATQYRYCGSAGAGALPSADPLQP